MRMATRDRGQILDVAGFHSLSPGLRDGRPALLPEGEPSGRTGWAPFFEAMERSGLALAWDPAGPGEPALVTGSEARPLERHRTVADGAASARRFLRALRREALSPPGTPPT